jgi:hypothetical protein
LRVLGGGQRNDFWLQLKADITGLPVEAVETEELTLLGAALLGGVGAGAYRSLAEARQAVRHQVRVFEPEPGLQALPGVIPARLPEGQGVSSPGELDALVTLSRALGDPAADYAILAEGKQIAAHRR